MELLELKSAWDIIIQETISKNSIDEFVITKSANSRSKTVLSKIKRVMYFKFIFGGLTLLSGIVMVAGLFIAPEKFIFLERIFNLNENRIFLSSVVLFVSGMLFANFLVFRGIINFNHSINLKSSLQRFIKIMERTIKLNIYSGTIFNTAAITWVFYAFYFKGEPFLWGARLIVLAIVPFITFTAMYFWSRYEQQLKFGNYLNQLKSNLKDIEQSDEQ